MANIIQLYTVTIIRYVGRSHVCTILSYYTYFYYNLSRGNNCDICRGRKKNPENGWGMICLNDREPRIYNRCRNLTKLYLLDVVYSSFHATRISICCRGLRPSHEKPSPQLDSVHTTRYIKGDRRGTANP